MSKADTYLEKLSKLLDLLSLSFEDFKNANFSDVKFSKTVESMLLAENITSIDKLAQLGAERIFLVVDERSGLLSSLYNSLKRFYDKTIFSKKYQGYDSALRKFLDDLKEKDDSFLDHKIPFELASSIRLKHVFQTNGVFTLKDLSKLSLEDILAFNQLGKKTLFELNPILETVLYHNYGFTSVNKSIAGTAKSISIEELLHDQSDGFLEQTIIIDPEYRRLFNILAKCGIFKFKDILNVGVNNILLQKNCGKRTIKDLKIVIENAIREYDANDSLVTTNLDKYIDLFSKKFPANFDISQISVDPGFEFCRKKLLEFIAQAADVILTSREATIFKLRHCSLQKPTLEEIGKRFSLSRERIRQIDKNLTKKMILSFSKSCNVSSLDPVVNFYFTLLFVGEDKIVDFTHYLIQEAGIDGEIIKSQLIQRGVLTSKNKFFSTENKITKVELPPNSPAVLKRIKGIKFIKTVFNFDGLKALNSDEIKLYKTEHPAPRNVERLFSNMSHNREYISIYGKPFVNNKYHDASLVIGGTYVILVNIYDKTESLLSNDVLCDEKSDRKYCKEVGIGCSYLSLNYKSINLFRNSSVKPSIEAQILSTLKMSTSQYVHDVNLIAEKYKTTTTKVIGVGIRNNLVFEHKPLTMWYTNQTDERKQNCAILIEEINCSPFSREELIVIGAVYDLSHNYLKKDKELWFGTIRVFLQGYQGSHLYNECKGMKYFGALKIIKSSKLKEILNKFADLEILKVHTNANDKTYYLLNEELIRLSKLKKVTEPD